MSRHSVSKHRPLLDLLRGDNGKGESANMSLWASLVSLTPEERIECLWKMSFTACVEPYKHPWKHYEGRRNVVELDAEALKLVELLLLAIDDKHFLSIVEMPFDLERQVAERQAETKVIIETARICEGLYRQLPLFVRQQRSETDRQCTSEVEILENVRTTLLGEVVNCWSRIEDDGHALVYLPFLFEKAEEHNGLYAKCVAQAFKQNDGAATLERQAEAIIAVMKSVREKPLSLGFSRTWHDVVLEALLAGWCTKLRSIPLLSGRKPPLALQLASLSKSLPYGIPAAALSPIMDFAIRAAELGKFADDLAGHISTSNVEWRAESIDVKAESVTLTAGFESYMYPDTLLANLEESEERVQTWKSPRRLTVILVGKAKTSPPTQHEARVRLRPDRNQ